MVLKKIKHIVATAKKSGHRNAPLSLSGRRMAKMLVVMLMLFGGIFGYKLIRVLFVSHPLPLPVTVSSVIVKTQEWESKLRSVGTLVADKGVDVTTELAGMVKTIPLIQGAKVKQGDILVELNIDSEMAQLSSLKASAELAEITYNRNKSQLAIQAVSQATVDGDKADFDNKRAQVAQQEAIIAKKIIRAPFDGIIGITQINPGQYLNPGDKIVTLQSLDPIDVDFSLPQQALNSVKVGQKITIALDTYPDEIFTGIITSMDPKIDMASRNILFEATIENPDFKLYPGMFGEVEILTGTYPNTIVIPKIAISFNPFGEIVYIIREKGKDKAGKPILMVEQTFVTVGESRNDETVILKGLKEGDQIVTAGQLKLKNETIVSINNTVKPESAPSTTEIDE
jgi:membrane fusion protein (multidrug efflux system)